MCGGSRYSPYYLLYRLLIHIVQVQTDWSRVLVSLQTLIIIAYELHALRYLISSIIQPISPFVLPQRTVQLSAFFSAFPSTLYLVNQLNKSLLRFHLLAQPFHAHCLGKRTFDRGERFFDCSMWRGRPPNVLSQIVYERVQFLSPGCQSLATERF